MAANCEIALVDYSFKLLICMFFFLFALMVLVPNVLVEILEETANTC